MSDLFYTVVRSIGRRIFWLCSRPVVLHIERTERAGPYLLVCTHLSAFDVPILIRHARRKLDFVSIAELFAHRLIRWFYGSMNAFPLDRSRADRAAVRNILKRLERGRVVAMFPEGGIRTRENSVLSGGRMKPGAGRIAKMANVPIVPAVVLNSSTFGRVRAWLPIRKSRYGLIIGEAMTIAQDADFEEALRGAFMKLADELLAAMNDR